jgi:hypothetical protein
MNIEITTIETKKFLVTGLISILLLIALSIGLAMITEIRSLVLLTVPGIIIIGIVGHKISKTKTIINLDNPDYISINSEMIKYSDIVGYFENETGLTQSALSLRLNTEKSIHIISSNIGDEGKIFRKIETQIINQIKANNSNARVLEYQDIYVKQMNYLRPILIGMAGLVILFDIFIIYSLITGNIRLPWQIFFVNFLLIGMIPYMKRRNN